MDIHALPKLPKVDLDHMFDGLGEVDWQYFTGKRLFFTGGTGFIGKWMLSALVEADLRLGLDCTIEVLTRSPKVFAASMPSLAAATNIRLHEGDVRSFEFPHGKFDIVVHGATDVVVQNTPLETFSTCVDGSKRILDFARVSGAQDFLITSSGAVYGRHPSTSEGVSEGYAGGPDPTLPSSAYGEGKRVSEWLACAQGAETGLKVKIARIYAQVGPYLPMDKHFAIGNFINDALADREIIIRGDGTPFRSYLYAADTAVWLWAMVVRGDAGRAWNVGGSVGISIADLADRVSKLLKSTKGIKVLTPANPNGYVEKYVPNVTRALKELSLPEPVSLDNAILRTAQWLRLNHRIAK
jgi:nucleoside-diphosphate-sugar epimerase